MASTSKPSVVEQAARVAAEEAAEKQRLAALPTPPVTKKKRTKRVAYPGSVQTDADGKKVYTKYTEIPADFNPKLHRPLKSKNFADDSAFLEFRALRLETRVTRLIERVASMRKKALLLRTDPAAAEKFKKQEKAKKLRELLAKLDKEQEEQDAKDAFIGPVQA